MKFKKPRGILLGFGYGAMVIAAALFFLVPVICKDGFSYETVNGFVAGIKGLFTFNFVNVLYTALLILFVMAFAVFVLYAIVSIKKKHASHLVILLFTLIAVFASYVFISVYFLADVTFNGVEGKLLDSMLKADGQMLGKILSSIAIALAVASNVLLFVHMFIDLFSMVVSEQVNELENKVNAEVEKLAEEKAAEVIAAQPAPAPAPAPVVEAAVEEVASEPAVESVEDFEDRKRKELQLFKECVDSGYFTEYEEIELPEALEGFDEEPVCEGSEIEEKSAFISRRSVHVGYTHD